MVTQTSMELENMDSATEEDESVDEDAENKSIFEILMLRGDELLSDPGAKWLVGNCTSLEDAIEKLRALFRAFVEDIENRSRRNEASPP